MTPPMSTAPLTPDQLATVDAAWSQVSIADWLDSVRARGYTLCVEEGEPGELWPHLAPGASRGCHPVFRDAWFISRFRHALVVAASGTHPVWWDHVARRGPMPATADLLDECATCGSPDLSDYDRHGMPWCEEHA